MPTHHQHYTRNGRISSIIVGNRDDSVCEMDWGCRKRGTQATGARQGDLIEVTRAAAPVLERMYTFCICVFERISSPLKYYRALAVERSECA